jgi:serine/threonine protein kinase/WD40 repeat protein
MEAKLAPSASLLALPDGAELVGDYRIVRVLGAGGFGITYLADEKALDRLVTIKEYFPADFAARRDGSAVPRSQDATTDYQWGLDRFIEEAQTLARFDHPNIVRVHRYFRANNTAYMVLHFEEGGSFKSWLKGLGRAPRQTELDKLTAPLLDALETIHEADFLHRDIAPDNIMVRRDGSPVLIDFGSARGAIASHSRTVSALVKPGYSPYEQYATTGANQGPWTDIYALGATLYHAIAGKRPPDAPSRVVEDEHVPAGEAALSSYRSGFLQAIDRALRIEVGERPQTIAEWRGILLAPDPVRKPSRLGLKLPRALTGSGGAQAAPPGNPVPPVEVPASLVPPPPDAPQRQGQLLDFIEALKKRGSPLLAPRKEEAKAAKAARERPTAPPALAARLPAEPQFGLGYGPAPPSARASPPAAADAAPPAPAPARPARRRGRAAPKPRRVWRLPSRRWRSAAFRVAAGVTIASLAVAYQESGPRSAAPTAAQMNESAPVALPMPLVGHQGVVVAAASGDSDRWIVSAGADATVRLWSASSGALVRTIELQEGPVTAFAVDKQRALAGHKGGIIVLWDLELGERLATVQHGSAPIVSLVFIGEANAFAAAGQDGSLALFNIDAPEAPPARLDGEESGGPIVAAARSRALFVSGGYERTVRLWRTEGPTLVRAWRHPSSEVTAAGISDDGAYVAGGGADGLVSVWSNTTLRGVRMRGKRTLKAHNGQVTAVALGPRGVLATAGEDGSVKLWTLYPVRSVRPLAEAVGPVRSLSFSRDGRRLYAAGQDGVIRVWPVTPLPAPSGAT